MTSTMSPPLPDSLTLWKYHTILSAYLLVRDSQGR